MFSLALGIMLVLAGAKMIFDGIRKVFGDDK